jgi:hypothetical protein
MPKKGLVELLALEAMSLSVSNLEATAEEASANRDITHDNHMDDGPRRSTKARRPNTRVQGLAWV